MPHFQLVTVDGTALGARHLGRPDWATRERHLHQADEPNLRVVRELDTGNDDPEMHFTVLVVDASDYQRESEETADRPLATPG